LAQILLADDNQVILQLLRRLIESHAGWQICGEASDGQQALAKAVELKPDLVVLDFAMPGLNGLQVAAQISRACPSPVRFFLAAKPTNFALAGTRYKSGSSTNLVALSSWPTIWSPAP
jgi:YesN/AraC family two-component response regulator